MTKQVKQKARALLGQQEEEMRRRTLPAAASTPAAEPPAPDMAPDMTGLEWTMRAAAEAPNMAPAMAPTMAPAQTALAAAQPTRPPEGQARVVPGGVRRGADVGKDEGCRGHAHDGAGAATSATADGAGVGGARSAVVGKDGAVVGNGRAVMVEGSAVLGEGSDGVGEGSDEGSALQRLALSQARLHAELSVERIRSQTLEGELNAAQADLQQLRHQAVLQADSQNLDYLRHVIVKFIELEGSDESEQLFEVIATVLQFDEKDVLRLVKALAERKAAARGRLSRLFGL